MSTARLKKNWISALPLLTIVCLLSWMLNVWRRGPHYVLIPLVQAVVLVVICSLLVCLLFILLIGIFGTAGIKSGFLNFLIGDNGTYSLARLQAVSWAVVIITTQFASVGALLLNESKDAFALYRPVFSETAIWLLGLSLTSYIAVKTVSVKNIAENPNLIAKRKVIPKWGDILLGPNGMDFSKCQMLIWTLLAILVYETKTVLFLAQLMSSKPVVIDSLFNHFYDEYSSKPSSLTVLDAYVPYLPWSFVVLMGLSQGAYVGRKLVPEIKLDDLKENNLAKLKMLTDKLSFKKKQLEGIRASTNTSADDQIGEDANHRKFIDAEITALEDQIQDLQQEINQINKYLNPNR